MLFLVLLELAFCIILYLAVVSLKRECDALRQKQIEMADQLEMRVSSCKSRLDHLEQAVTPSWHPGDDLRYR